MPGAAARASRATAASCARAAFFWRSGQRITLRSLLQARARCAMQRVDNYFRGAGGRPRYACDRFSSTLLLSVPGTALVSGSYVAVSKNLQKAQGRPQESSGHATNFLPIFDGFLKNLFCSPGNRGTRPREPRTSQPWNPTPPEHESVPTDQIERYPDGLEGCPCIPRSRVAPVQS